MSTRHFGSPRGSSILAQRLFARMARSLSAQLSISRFVADHVDGPSDVVYTGVPVVARVEPRKPFVLVAQRLEVEKHTDLALRAWAQSGAQRQGWMLRIAGDGAQREPLERLVRELGVSESTEFLGHRNDVDDLLCQAGVVLAPTPREGLGLLVLEAMAAGTPVIAAGGGGHLETVGVAAPELLFEPGDSAHAARILDELVRDEERRERLGNSLRELQRRSFTLEKQVGGTVALYERLSGGRRNDLIVLSLEPWDDVWRRNQYLIDGMLRRDPALRVLFVEPASDVAHALVSRRRPVRGRGLRTARGYEGRLTLFQPTKVLPRVVGGLADALLRAGVARAARASGMVSPVYWINDPGWADLAGGNARTLYDITDDWVAAVREPRQLRRTIRNEQRLLRNCDEVVVCSPALQVSKGRDRPVTLIPNAVDVARYRERIDRPADLPQGATATYVGTLHEDRLDVELVARTAEGLAADGASLVLIGPNALSADSTGRLQHAGVRILGAREHHRIPAYLQHSTVLIVPHIVDDFTDSLDPIKRYEYSAVGRPIVSTPVAGFRERSGIDVVVADRDEFTAAVVAAVRENSPTAPEIDVPDWAERIDDMAAVVDRLRGAPSG